MEARQLRRSDSEDSGEIAGHERDFVFTNADFARIRAMIYEVAGISLSDHKRDMVYSRLARRLRARSLTVFSEYLDYLERTRDDAEWEAFTNALTTNLTSFFREAHHFPILSEFVAKRRAPVSIWCCAASTGEEPYSIAMTLQEALKGTGARAGQMKVRPELRQMLTFSRLNLHEDRWPVQGPFDVIFCRNVMIYFDKPTQGRILERFVPLMKPDALLFAGHSENFTYVSRSFRLRGQTVYELASGAVTRGAQTLHAAEAVREEAS